MEQEVVALNIAKSLLAERGRLYSLAESIRKQLDSDSITCGLAEVLSDLLGECNENESLIECLEATQEKAQ